MLVEMAKADLKEHTNENEFLFEIARKFGIPESDVILMKAGLQIPEKELPRTEQERMKFFFYILSMMQMDNQVTQHEVEVAREAGLVLGLNPLLVIELIKAFGEQLNPNSPEEDLNKIIVKYLN